MADTCPKCGTKLTVTPPTIKTAPNGKTITKGGKAWCPNGCYSETRLPGEER